MTTAFEHFELHPHLLRAVDDLDYATPTPIQAAAIPVLMTGRDVLGQAQTGTGKTAAFALPMLNALEQGVHGVQGLVVTPTRELANQVARAIHDYGQHQRVRVLPVYGGQSYTRQIRRLERGVDIVVGTPGRMLDLIRKEILDLSNVSYLVLDEADEMLSMGFIEDIEAILSETPASRQTALFSATLPDRIRRLGDRYMRDPEEIVVNPEQMTVAATEQRYILVHDQDKVAALTRLLEVGEVTRALVFTRTRARTAETADALLARGFPAEALHGEMPQAARETVMGRFRDGLVDVLVATDVAARGLDIDDISHVINFDVPYDVESYVHRIGRTGRAGKTGIAITLAMPRERRRLRAIEAYTQEPIERVTLPSEADVMAYRENAFLAKMRTELAAPEGATLGATSDHTDDLVTRLYVEEGYRLEDIAAAAIRLLRAGEQARPIEPVAEVHERSQRSRRSRSQHRSRREGAPQRSEKQEPGMVRLVMDAGKAQGIRPRDVVGAIAGETGIAGSAIGAIDIQQRQTFVDVKEKHVGKVLYKMQGRRLRGQPVTLSRAR